MDNADENQISETNFLHGGFSDAQIGEWASLAGYDPDAVLLIRRMINLGATTSGEADRAIDELACADKELFGRAIMTFDQMCGEVFRVEPVMAIMMVAALTAMIGIASRNDIAPPPRVK